MWENLNLYHQSTKPIIQKNPLQVPKTKINFKKENIMKYSSFKALPKSSKASSHLLTYASPISLETTSAPV